MELTLKNTGILRVNTWIVPLTESQVFIVDPACCELSRDSDVLIKYLDKEGLTPAGIFLTHGHFDHIMGLKVLKGTVRASIVVDEGGALTYAAGDGNVYGW